MSLKINEACCSLPVIQSDYKPKGDQSAKYAGLETYSVGDRNAKSALTKQGADILASALKLRVIMPDFFEGKPWPVAKHPPQNDEDKKAFGQFFSTTAAPGDNVAKLTKVIEQLKTEGVTKVGVYGLCWGGKIVTLIGSAPPDSLKAVASIHPAMASGKDAENLKIPFACFASKDEPADEIAAMEKHVKANSAIADKSVFKTYDTMKHGFAAARGDVSDPQVKKEYESLYASVVSFFSQTL